MTAKSYKIHIQHCESTSHILIVLSWNNKRTQARPGHETSWPINVEAVKLSEIKLKVVCRAITTKTLFKIYDSSCKYKNLIKQTYGHEKTKQIRKPLTANKPQLLRVKWYSNINTVNFKYSNEALLLHLIVDKAQLTHCTSLVIVK